MFLIPSYFVLFWTDILFQSDRESTESPSLSQDLTKKTPKIPKCTPVSQLKKSAGIRPPFPSARRTSPSPLPSARKTSPSPLPSSSSSFSRTTILSNTPRVNSLNASSFYSRDKLKSSLSHKEKKSIRPATPAVITLSSDDEDVCVETTEDRHRQIVSDYSVRTGGRQAVGRLDGFRYKKVCVIDSGKIHSFDIERYETLSEKDFEWLTHCFSELVFSIRKSNVRFNYHSANMLYHETIDAKDISSSFTYGLDILLCFEWMLFLRYFQKSQKATKTKMTKLQIYFSLSHYTPDTLSLI